MTFQRWFVHSVYDDSKHSEPPAKASHYRSCIYPEPDQDFIDAMPELVPLSRYIEDISKNLELHPEAMVGEVGLDRSFRIPDPNQPKVNSSRHTLSKYRTETEHQAMILQAQLSLAGKYGRACSIHGVQAHGYLYNVISKLWDGQERLSKSAQRKIESKAKKHLDAEHKETQGMGEDHVFESGIDPQSFPPRICLHSYSGTADMLGSWLNPKVPADIFFSFSQVINGRYDRWQEVVSKVPDDRLLIESDYHDARLIDNSLDEALNFVCKAKNWTEQQGRQQLRDNWLRFVGRNMRPIMILQKHR